MTNLKHPGKCAKKRPSVDVFNAIQKNKSVRNHTQDSLPQVSIPVDHPKPIRLCFRCEHRAKFMESGHGPRYECGQSWAVCSCYMYRPVKPVALVRNDGEESFRPTVGPSLFSARCHGADIPMRLKGKNIGGTIAVWWVPVNSK